MITTPEPFEALLAYICYNNVKNTTKSIPGKIDIYKLMYNVYKTTADHQKGHHLKIHIERHKKLESKQVKLFFLKSMHKHLI